MQTFKEINDLFKKESQGKSTTVDQRKKILLVDDNRDIQNSLIEILKSEYQLICCYNWEEVENRISSEIDLIILDIKMSGYDGFTIFNRIKEKHPNSKIIFNSAYAGDDEATKKIEDLPHNGYLTKGSYSIQDLKTKLKQVINL